MIIKNALSELSYVSSIILLKLLRLLAHCKVRQQISAKYSY